VGPAAADSDGSSSNAPQRFRTEMNAMAWMMNMMTFKSGLKKAKENTIRQRE